MRNISRTHRIVGFSACAALLAVAGATCLHRGQSAPTADHTLISKAQLLSRSEPLVRALLSDGNRFETTTYQNTTFTSSGQTVHNISVDYTDPASGDSAHLLWNADSGELMRASRFRPRERGGEFDEKSSRSIALSLAWDWFHAMKIDRPSEEWHIVGTRQKHYAQWDIFFQAGDRCAIMTVSTCSGQLVQTVCGHLPDAKLAWAPVKPRISS